MKKYINLCYLLSFFIFVISTLSTSAQVSELNKGVVFRTSPSAMSKAEFARNYKLDVGSIEEYHSLAFDKIALKSKSQFTLNIGAKELVINKDKVVERGENDFSFVGDVEGSKYGSAIISVRNDNIVGIVTTDKWEYNIVTFGKKDYCLVRFNNSNPESCLTEGEEYYIKTDDSYKDFSTLSAKETTSHNIIYDSKASSSNSCNLRIIALYTPAVDALVSDIRNLINNHINRANRYNEEADVNQKWELAYAGITSYDEYYIDPGDGRFTDLFYFRADTDGHMDEVHDLREKYSADVCILISECQYTTACGGVAVRVDATNSSEAFCLAHAKSWQISSFEHEIGHLLAGGHDDGSAPSPYAYGHGYVSPTSAFKTVMGTPFVNRIHWSTPDKTYNGEVTGTANHNDVARMMEHEVPKKVRFLQPQSHVTISNADVIQLNYGEIIAEQSVTIDNITIKDGSKLKVRSAETTLSQGLTIEKGAELEILNEAVYGCY